MTTQPSTKSHVERQAEIEARMGAIKDERESVARRARKKPPGCAAVADADRRLRELDAEYLKLAEESMQMIDDAREVALALMHKSPTTHSLFTEIDAVAKSLEDEGSLDGGGGQRDWTVAQLGRIRALARQGLSVRKT